MSAFSIRRDDERGALPTSEAKPLTLVCHDGVTLGAHLWEAASPESRGSIVINSATGVLARYYHHYARFLAVHGFDVLTYDYRGIGQSRPTRLRGCGYRWRDWGEQDFDTALRFMHERSPNAPLSVVGHSIGGFLPGLSKNAQRIARMLTIGAQYAYWRDYAPGQRVRLLLKWHIAMPAMTALFGYFPGRSLGWLEDLPAGVANEWSFRRARMELSHPVAERASVIRRFDAVAAPILAIAMSDDEFATIPAIRRTLSYYRNAAAYEAVLTPAALGFQRVGHFGLFHVRHAAGFWLDTLLWLRDGVNPWPRRVEDASDVIMTTS